MSRSGSACSVFVDEGCELEGGDQRKGPGTGVLHANTESHGEQVSLREDEILAEVWLRTVQKGAGGRQQHQC